MRTYQTRIQSNVRLRLSMGLRELIRLAAACAPTSDGTKPLQVNLGCSDRSQQIDPSP